MEGRGDAGVRGLQVELKVLVLVYPNTHTFNIVVDMSSVYSHRASFVFPFPFLFLFPFPAITFSQVGTMEMGF